MGRPKRKPKKGSVYLLKSDSGVFKYGCTTLDPVRRCKRINIEKRNFGKFSVIDSFKCNDIYDHECKLKWKYWDSHQAFSEFFVSECDKSPTEVFSLYKESL